MKPIQFSWRRMALRSVRCAPWALVAAVAIVGLHSSHAQPAPGANHAVVTGTVIGSGRLQSESRAITGFEAIEVSGPMDLLLRQGPREAVQVRADHNILPLIQTRVVTRAGVPTLEIGGKPGVAFSTRNPITVIVDLATLSALTLAGSGDVTGADLKAAALRIVSHGSGNVQLAPLHAQRLTIGVSGSGSVLARGRSGRVEVVIEGSGDVDVQGLGADDVAVRIDGSGNAKVQANRTLNVKIGGSGNLTHIGGASVQSEITGSGSLNRP